MPPLNQWDCIEFNLKSPDPTWTEETCPSGLPLHLVLAIANKGRAWGWVTWAPDESVDRIGLIVPGEKTACGVPLSALVNVEVLPAVAFGDTGGHTYMIAKPTTEEGRILLRDYQECHLLPSYSVDAMHAA